MIHFFYEVQRQCDGAVLAEGETVHIAVDREGNRREFPEKYFCLLKEAVGRS
jgi:acyl-CoA thioesterase FadM